MYLAAYKMLTDAGYKAVGHDRYSRVEWHMRRTASTVGHGEEYLQLAQDALWVIYNSLATATLKTSMNTWKP